jgi:hypothetical protein
MSTRQPHQEHLISLETLTLFKRYDWVRQEDVDKETFFPLPVLAIFLELPLWMGEVFLSLLPQPMTITSSSVRSSILSLL